MAKRSVFRDFVTAIRKHWQTELPDVRPVTDALGPQMPKASTLYAGVAQPANLHVFVNFQHSPKAWEVGCFTVNFLLVTDPESVPEILAPRYKSIERERYREGSYRIGDLLGIHDKWWRLKGLDPALLEMDLLLGGSGKNEPFVSEKAAVDDVTRDVRAALKNLGLQTS